MTDYISREAALEAAKKSHLYFDLKPIINSIPAADVLERASGIIGVIPAADVRPVVRGKLTRHVLKNANVPWGFDCTACGAWFVIGEDTAEKYNYCPNCGAKMEESDGT